MPETIPLGNGHEAVIRTELTGGDQKWFLIQSGKLRRANGTGRPARSEPDPDNSAVLKDYPAEPAYLTEEDSFTLFDMLLARLLVSCTMPEVMPWTAEVRDVLDLDVINAIDEPIGEAMNRLRGVAAPKKKSGDTSATTSPDAAPAPTDTTPPPSTTPPAS